MNISVYSPLLYAIKQGDWNIPCFRFGQCYRWKTLKDINPATRKRVVDGKCWASARNLKAIYEKCGINWSSEKIVCADMTSRFKKEAKDRMLFNENFAEIIFSISTYERLKDNVFVVTSDIASMCNEKKRELLASDGEETERIFEKTKNICFAVVSDETTNVFISDETGFVCLGFSNLRGSEYIVSGEYREETEETKKERKSRTTEDDEQLAEIKSLFAAMFETTRWIKIDGVQKHQGELLFRIGLTNYYNDMPYDVWVY